MLCHDAAIKGSVSSLGLSSSTALLPLSYLIKPSSESFQLLIAVLRISLPFSFTKRLLLLSALTVLSVLLSACTQTAKKHQEPESDQSNDAALATSAEATPPSILTVPDVRFGSDWQDCRHILSISKDQSLWSRIASSQVFDTLALAGPSDHDEAARRVAKELQVLLKKKDQVERILNRGKPFIATLVAQLESRQLPIELALLPAIESGYKVSAYSRAGAAGLWQLMPRTARELGLKTGWWFDERHDPLSATASAMDYLEWLNTEFKQDWSLSLAAYNAGPGRVSRAQAKAIKQKKNSSYWYLDLAPETRQYVPKLIALHELIRYRKTYGLKLDEPAAAQDYIWVDAKQQIDIQKAAQFCEQYTGYTSLEFLSFNAGFRRWATPPDGPHKFRIPAAYAKQFQKDLASIGPEERLGWGLYRIRRGDNLGRIAKRFKTRVSTLKKMNGIRGHRITAGDQILVPGLPAATAAEKARLAKLNAKKTPVDRKPSGFNKLNYVVKSGDNLWSIARRLDTRVRYIKESNTIGVNNLLKPGTTLIVPVPYYDPAPELEVAQVPMITQKAGVTHYRVQSGDSLYSIAKQFKTKIDAILEWNQLNEGDYIQPGQTLLLHLQNDKERSQPS